MSNGKRTPTASMFLGETIFKTSIMELLLLSPLLPHSDKDQVEVRSNKF